jgi:hypothetical protein
MNIFDALSQQKQPVQDTRITCSNGLLSISNAVFGVALFKAGYSDIDDYISDIALDDREQFLKQIGQYD